MYMVSRDKNKVLGDICFSSFVFCFFLLLFRLLLLAEVARIIYIVRFADFPVAARILVYFLWMKDSDCFFSLLVSLWDPGMVSVFVIERSDKIVC